MLVEERYRRIRTLLKSHGTVSVEHMTQALGVSRETVRRDLVELETAGEIRRVHGGAMLVESELPISVRAGIRVKEKRALARGAQAYIGSGQTLFIDAGTTTAILAEALGSLSGLHVVTNSVAVANELSGERAAKSGGAFGSPAWRDVQCIDRRDVWRCRDRRGASLLRRCRLAVAGWRGCAPWCDELRAGGGGDGRCHEP